jgi:hypothetical protein
MVTMNFCIEIPPRSSDSAEHASQILLTMALCVQAFWTMLLPSTGKKYTTTL